MNNTNDTSKLNLFKSDIVYSHSFYQKYYSKFLNNDSILRTFTPEKLVLNSDRTKLSKRQGDVAVEDYNVEPIASGGCENGNGYLSANALDNATYAWTGPNNFTSNTRTNNLSNLTTDLAGVGVNPVITASIPLTERVPVAYKFLKAQP